MGKNDSIDYNNLTYGDILRTIKKLGINMCNDEKLLKYQLKNAPSEFQNIMNDIFKEKWSCYLC